jgi:hypothetical protein
LNGSKHWLVLAAVAWACAATAQTPAQPATPSGSGRPQTAAPKTPPAEVPDEELIEFLGEDDHGDEAWWEFLKKTPPGGQTSPPSQGTKPS